MEATISNTKRDQLTIAKGCRSMNAGVWMAAVHYPAAVHSPAAELCRRKGTINRSHTKTVLVSKAALVKKYLNACWHLRRLFHGHL